MASASLLEYTAKLLAGLLLVAIIFDSETARAQLADNNNDYFTTLTQGRFKHAVQLDADRRVQLQWSTVISSVASTDGVVQQPDVIVIEVSAPAKGYIGLGLSPTGGMKGADIMLMWVDDATGRAYLQGRFGTGNVEPEVYADQSAILAYDGSQNETHTVFKIARLVNASCTNSKVLSIQPYAMQIIYSYSDQDPTLPSAGSHARYHGPHNRGVKTLYLLDDQSGKYEQDKLAAFFDANKKWEFKADNFEIPAVDTHYQCEFFQFPNLTRDAHIVGFQPMIDPARIHNVHHFLVHLCDYNFVGSADKNQSTEAYDCNSFSPEAQKIRKGAANCMVFLLWAWGVGGTSTFMPRDVGYRLTPRDSGRYIIIETHYDNPTVQANMRDSSGVRMLLMDAPVLRAQEASHFWIGTSGSPEMTIPNGQESFTIPVVCTPECTQRFVPQEGVTIFSLVLHAHTLGKSIALRHFRRASAGDKKEVELSPVAADPGYDFNYQEWRPVNVTILPGDRLVLECNYSSLNRNGTTFGGESTREEMCMAFIYTTPPLNMSLCVSSVTMGGVLQSIDEPPLPNGGKPSLLELSMRKGNYTQIQHIQDRFEFVRRMKSFDWSRKGSDGTPLVNKLQKFYVEHEQAYVCRGNINFTDAIGGTEKVLEVWHPYQPPSECPNN